MKLRQIFCRHDWQCIDFFIYNADLKYKGKSKIKCKWFLETKMFMDSIGASGIWPYFTKECLKCGKQGDIRIDTLIEAQFIGRGLYLLQKERSAALNSTR